jgi:hypothetical protein
MEHSPLWRGPAALAAPVEANAAYPQNKKGSRTDANASLFDCPAQTID